MSRATPPNRPLNSMQSLPMRSAARCIEADVEDDLTILTYSNGTCTE